MCSGTNAKHYCSYQIAQGNKPKVGDVCLAKPQDAHPTQAAYGEVDAACVQLGLEAYASSKDGTLRAYLQSKTVPTIIGPDGSSVRHVDSFFLRCFASGYLEGAEEGQAKAAQMRP